MTPAIVPDIWVQLGTAGVSVAILLLVAKMVWKKLSDLIDTLIQLVEKSVSAHVEATSVQKEMIESIKALRADLLRCPHHSDPTLARDMMDLVRFRRRTGKLNHASGE